MCKISIVTSVFNCEKYIGETIQSVIDQTFEDWEFIIIDDCSTDKSGEIIQQYAAKESRIKYIINDSNQGQCNNLNYGISISKGKYIARLDHDDLCKKSRLEKQFNYMEDYLDVDLLGCAADIWQNGEIRSVKSFREIATSFEDIKFTALFKMPFIHSSFFIRKESFSKYDIRYGRYDFAEDYGLILDFIWRGKVEAVPECLVTYRVFEESTTKTISKEIVIRETETSRIHYLNAFPELRNDYLIKAIKGQIQTKEEFESLNNDYLDYCKMCYEINNKEDMLTHPYIFIMYRRLLDWQTGSMVLLRNYATCEFREKKWLLSRRGLALIKHCVFREDKRFKNL